MLIRRLIILMTCSFFLIGNLGCFIQPVTQIEKKFFFIDYLNTPALRLLEPVKAHCARKNPETGEWEDVGWGELCVGGLFKGSKPNQNFGDILKEEVNGK